MDDLPFVSVIVPAKNEEQFISDCLDSLLSQNYPSELYEIIVVDNLSTDKTAQIVSAKGITVLTCLSTTIGGVRNFGAKHSRGDILAYIDADCVAPSFWISGSVRRLVDEGLSAVGGDALKRPEGSWVEQWWVLPISHSVTEEFTLNGCSMFFYKRVFEDLGGFDESINASEDRLLSKKISVAKGKVEWSSAADVIHYGNPQTVSQFFKRQFWHASSYVKTGLGWADKTFVFSLLYLLGFFCIVLAIIVCSFIFLSIGFVFVFLGPFLFSLKKILLSKENNYFFYFIPIFVLSNVYFIGRSLGFVYSISGKKFVRRKK